MGAMTEIKVPDIGDFRDVPIIEIMVKPGDKIKPEDPLISLESDKATMDVPAPSAGVVKELKVKAGDKVSEGSTILLLEADGAAQPAMPAVHSPPPPTHPHAGIAEVRVPDIGDFKDVPIIEIMVKPGDKIKPEDPLISLESDKATMDVPAPLGGAVQELKVKVGDKVSEGAVILTLATEAAAASPQPSPVPLSEVQAKTPPPVSPSALAGEGRGEGMKTLSAGIDEANFVLAYASPAVRKLARELGVDLDKVKGSGDKGRILKEDVQAFTKGGAAPATAAPAGAGAGLDLLPWPKVDFAKFGPIQAKPLSRIKKISGANLHRNWVMIPHVTNNEDADITDLEAFRVQMNKEYAAGEGKGPPGSSPAGIKVTMLAFLIKTAVAALKKFPEFNASLDGDNLIFKKYYHIGFAADTPNGLVVPVIKNADEKGVLAIAKETSELAKQARDGKLKPADMQGGCFSISSLGGIGGTYFTPIINAPEVAILGVCRSSHRPVWDGKQFAPRLILPLSLSYDHRVIDGAAAARFNSFFAGVLADMRRAML